MLTCADLFCGAGGFSEGFRQAGFRVTRALDIWAPAVLTHEKNHPETPAIRADILSYDPERIGPVDVLIGSPPCTEFSFANRGGSGDVREGMRLVYRFLRFVFELQPRWWVMENVPRVLDFLPDEVPLRALGIDKKGSLAIPVRAVLTSADYGTPQLRKRAFSGDFPLPEPTYSERTWRTLRDVVATLPDPVTRGSHRSRDIGLTGSVMDPVHGFELPVDQLTDHFSQDLVLTDEEVRENRKAKEDHSWYGRMAFPDDLDRPARTVMATNLRVARETTVIAAGRGRYRRLSVREASSVQGFPITYQWWGGSTSLRYKLVGNAVAPPVAFAVARAIVADAAQPVLERPYVVTRVTDPAPPPTDRGRPRALPLTRRFREHVPGSKVPGFRVDLDNRGTRKNGHLVEWRAMLYRGGGKALQHRPVRFADALGLLRESVPDRDVNRFTTAVERSLGGIPNASTLQRIRAERESGEVTPYVVLERIADVVERHFSEDWSLSRRRRVDRPQKRASPHGNAVDRPVPPRVMAALVATAFACEVANAHPEGPARRISPDPALPPRRLRLGGLEPPRRLRPR